MKFDVVRVLRTPHSERFVLQKEGRDAASLDLHYLLNGTVAGTLVIFDDSGIDDDAVSEVMKFIDESLLPEVEIGSDNLFFTAVKGRVLGSYQPENE